MIERYTNPEMGAIWDEENKFRRQLEVEIAVCQARYEAGEIPEADWADIRDKSDFKIERVFEIEKTVDHETIALLTAVAEFVGPASRHIHAGMTSSDVLDTSFALQLVQAVDLLLKDIDELIEAVRIRAIEHKDTLMMGRTHGVHAEPITFGLKLAIWYEELKRNRERLARAKEAVRIGKVSGAVGTYAHISPAIEKRSLEILGLEPAPVSNQVIQRDRYAEYASAVAICASSIDKFATEVRHLARTEVGEVMEPFRKGQKGSSAMPHKRNPMRSERMSGLARIIRGYLQAALENIPLWHERDISHSSAERIIFPDGTILLDYMMRVFKGTVDGMEVFPERMRSNMDLSFGVVFSQRIMLALCDKGTTREDAYKIVQRLGHKALDEKRMFQELVREDEEVYKLLSSEEIDNAIDPTFFLKNVDVIFERLNITTNLRNPWKELPRKPPFILPKDKDLLNSFNYNEKNHPRFEILPAPFLGRPKNAEIFLLSLNPGFKKEFDITAQNEDPDYVEQKRLSMEFKSRFPFFIIDPEFPGKPGYDWWQKKLKELIGLYDVRHVSEKIMCIQYFPYQSPSYKHQPHIPSQEFSFYLVKQAINFKKIIVVMRGKRYWFKSIPELENYPVIELKNTRNPTISHENMAPESFSKIQSALR